jgi:Ca2+-binding EF-hand superfamily protein
VEKRTSEVFKVLDSDEDGLISPDNIAIERLTKN